LDAERPFRKERCAGPARRGEVGDEAVVTGEGLSSRLALVVVGSAAMGASDDRALELFQATLALRGIERWQFDLARPIDPNHRRQVHEGEARVRSSFHSAA
jgi:hypothetical protein